MKAINKLILFVLFIGIVLFSACNKNYYSGSGKGGKNCGCPSHKGMTGY
jgi:hypothetical protein